MASAETACQLALREMQRQQEVSSEICNSMDALKLRHLAWQESVEDLLATVTSSLKELRQNGASKTSEKVEPCHHVKVELEPAIASGRRSCRENTPIDMGSLHNIADKNHHTSHMPELLEEVILDQEMHNEAHKDQTTWGKRRRILSEFVDSEFFEYLTGIIILANIITIGVEAELSLSVDAEVSWATTVEQVFLVLYSLELVMRLAGGGLQIFWSCWFLLDFFLVCVGMVALVVAPVLTGGGTQMDGFEKLLVVRGLRLLRLARVLRMVGRFKVVWRLVSGLLTAWDTMLSASGLILLWLFIFGCVAVEIVSKDEDLLADPVTGPIVAYSFGSVPRAILTLVQFVTMDSIAGVYFPLIMAKPWLAIYFMPLMVLISIGLMNLVTAVLVEHALQHATREEELARLRTKDKIKAALPELQTIFDTLDLDGSGHITQEEAANVPLTVFPPKVLDAVSAESMGDLFQMLDVDEGGTLTQAEFLEGLLNLLLLDVPIWAIQSLKLLRPLRKQSNEIAESLAELKKFLAYRSDLVSM